MNKSKILSLLIGGLYLFGLCGCAPGTETPDPDPDPGNTPVITDEWEQYAEEPVDYTKQSAEAEDESLELWFDHAFAKTPRGVTESSGRDTYKLYMGKNEKEDCQFFLSAEEAKQFSVRVSDFASESGETLETSLFYQYYFSMPYEGEEQEVPDAIPPVTEGQLFELSANTSQGFVLQAESQEDTPAGEYTADLEVFDSAGNQIKKATVFLHVWDFVLSDDSACRTAMWIEAARLPGGGDEETYKLYYDYLLDNRVNAYDLPYALDDARVDEYLNDERVNSFNILGFKVNRESGYTETALKTMMRAAYDKLSANEEWFEKGYFYLVDEPNPSEIQKLGWIAEYGTWLEECYPGYKQMSPFFTDRWYDNAHTQDWIEYLRPYINIWVPKTFAYTTLREYGSITDAQCLYQEGQEGARRVVRQLSRTHRRYGGKRRRGSVVVCHFAAFRPVYHPQHHRAGRRVPHSVLAAEDERRHGVPVLERQLLGRRRLEQPRGGVDAGAVHLRQRPAPVPRRKGRAGRARRLPPFGSRARRDRRLPGAHHARTAPRLR